MFFLLCFRSLRFLTEVIFLRKNMLNIGFLCINCGKEVLPIPKGSFRNHCPFCLYSLHLDRKIPGDRSSSCKGLMEPVRIIYNTKKGLQILHRCTQCGEEHSNIVCESMCQPDNKELVFHLMGISILLKEGFNCSYTR